MKVKYLLVILLLASMPAMAQHRKAQAAETDKPAAAADAPQVLDTARHEIEDIIPENADNFCTVLMQLMNDAGGNFERIRGKSIETTGSSTRYIAMGGIPGAITSGLYGSGAKWQYEGIVFQGTSRDDMQVAYDKFKRLMGDCLFAKGYAKNSAKNSSSKLDNYPDYTFTKTDNEGGKHGNHPHATLDIEYTPGADIYVLTVNLYNN